MKKFTFLTISLAFVFSGLQEAAADGRSTAVNLHNLFGKTKEGVRKNVSKESPRSYSARSAQAATLWRAATQKDFGWDGEEWVLDETCSFEYDDKGQTVVQEAIDYDGYVNRETMTWNENGMLATSLKEVADEAGAPFTETEKLARTYDDRVVSFITFNDQTVYSNDEWIPSNSYKQTVTRNEAGNVTLMERAVYYQGIYDPIYRLSLEYGEDGKAVSAEEKNLKYDYDTDSFVWETDVVFTDMVWENTDGQIVTMDSPFFGNNRLKSGKVSQDGMDMDLTVEYSEDGSFTAHLTGYDPEEEEDVDTRLIYTPVDDYGSNITRQVTDYIIDGFPYFTDEITETNIYDPNGLIILEEVKSGDVLMSWIESRVEGVVEYDEQYGYPLSWTLSEYDTEEYELYPVFRAEYSDYIGLTGIDEINGENISCGKPVYYDLQGRCISSPVQGGIYIRRTGSKTEKVIVR